MILIGMGANLPSIAGPPKNTLKAAAENLETRGISVTRLSRWYRSPAWPPSDQPWFVNAVAIVETTLDPASLLEQLHAVERAFGRERTVRNVARVLDVDLLAYDDLVRVSAPTVPHPRLGERAFVLLPLQDIAPDWRHPITDQSVSTLIALLPPDHQTSAIEEG